jgi:hypothetical protein
VSPLTTIGRRCVGALLLIALAAPVCQAQALSADGANNRYGQCAADEIAPESIEITEVGSGVWKGFTAFLANCGPLIGRLYYSNDRDLLRYEITPETKANRDWPEAQLRTEILRALLRRLFAVYGQRSRYAFATNAYPEVGERLAAAAAESREWDKQTGRPSAQTTAAFAKALLNREHGYPELAKTWAERNYVVRISGIEKVLVRPAGSMSAAERALLKAPVRDDDQLPVSAAIFYTIEKK